jgi:hypothetical protein
MHNCSIVVGSTYFEYKPTNFQRLPQERTRLIGAERGARDGTKDVKKQKSVTYSQNDQLILMCGVSKILVRKGKENTGTHQLKI